LGNYGYEQSLVYRHRHRRLWLADYEWAVWLVVRSRFQGEPLADPDESILAANAHGTAEVADCGSGTPAPSPPRGRKSTSVVAQARGASQGRSESESR